MTIYIDSEYKCHVDDANGLTAVETDAFDGKCEEYIEGYVYVPPGEELERGEAVIKGEAMFPWKPYEDLERAQRQHEHDELEDMREALKLLGVTDDA